MSKLPVPTAKEINEAHDRAKALAENAVSWAIKCGQLLQRKKDELGHGKFGEWAKTYCDFSYRSARAYMQAAEKAKQNGSALPFSSVRQALEPPPESKKQNSPKGAVPVMKAPADRPEATGETGADRPAAPIPPPATQQESPPPSEGEPEWTEADEAEYHAQEEINARARIEAAIAADDKLAEALEQIRQLSAELAVVKRSRDHYMNQAGVAARLVKARDREIAKLKKQIARQAA